MKCFHHPQVDAVAICKNCHEGLCADCAADLGNGVACKGRCEAEVAAIMEVQQRNKTAYQKAAGASVRSALWLGLFGFVFVAAGLLSWKSGGEVAFFLGLLFLVGTAFQYITARKYRRID